MVGTLRTSGLISVIAALTTTLLLTVATGKKAVIKRIFYHNRTGGNGSLRIGYVDVVAAAFQAVHPDILMVNGVDGIIDPVPLMGNTVDGFCADATATAGSTGTIVCQCTVGGAAPTDVQVMIEVEEI